MHTSHSLSTRVSAFAGHRLVAVGPLRSVVLSARQALDAEPNATILIFDDVEQRQMDRPGMLHREQDMGGGDPGPAVADRPFGRNPIQRRFELRAQSCRGIEPAVGADALHEKVVSGARDVACGPVDRLDFAPETLRRPGVNHASP